MRTHPTREAQFRSMEIDTAGARLSGDLTVPTDAHGVVLFAHGSGSSRRSTRNRSVANTLVEAGLATLLLDLLTSAEEEYDRFGGALRFDVARLAVRLSGAIDWLGRDPATRALPVGLFGASTGAAAALIAASWRMTNVRAVVSRGGRPDLAGKELDSVRCPTLLIVGGADPLVLDLNRQALARLRGPKELTVVPGATHLFEEPGALERVSELARDWFLHHVAAAARRDAG
jgi:dienelactone hydrolase